MVMGELVQETQVLVIGSGPGGYAAAFRAADLVLRSPWWTGAEARRGMPLSRMHPLQDVALPFGTSS